MAELEIWVPSSWHQALSGQRKWQVMGYYSEDNPGFHTHHSKHLGYPERTLLTILRNGEMLLLQASLHSIYSSSTRVNLFSLNEGEGREPAVSIPWLQLNARMEMARDIYISPSPYHSLAEGLVIPQPPAPSHATHTKSCWGCQANHSSLHREIRTFGCPITPVPPPMQELSPDSGAGVAPMAGLGE